MMFARILLFLLIVTADSVAAYDREALAAIYDWLGGGGWERSEGWLTDAPLAEWYGVETTEGRVTKINLASNGLTGTLPYQVGDLQALQLLDMRWNAISGSLPNELGSLASLETLLLTGNEFTGEIPWTLGGLSILKRLDLSYNGLTGKIPGELGELGRLESLGLHSNELEGEIPWNLSRATRLKRLILHNNDLEGLERFEFSDMPLLSHVNLAASGYKDVPEHKGTLIEDNLERTFSAAGLLDQTTRVIDNEGVRNFIGRVLSAVVVRDGLLDVNRSGLLEGIDADVVQREIDEFNGRLINAKDRVESLFDLERAMELYGRGGIGVPDAVSMTIPEQVSGSLIQNAAVAPEYASGGASVTRSTGPASIWCLPYQANWPHASVHAPGYIVGNADVTCSYVAGPSQLLTYSLHMTLDQWIEVWVFNTWVPKDYRFSQKSGINLSPTWQKRQTVVRTACSEGPGTFRTRFRLFIVGSSTGWFNPFPGTRTSASRFVEC